MGFSQGALFVSAVSLLLAANAWVGCSNPSNDQPIPPASAPPAGITFMGGTFGGACSGYVYLPAGVGWAFCNGGVWAYTTVNPSTDGFTPVMLTVDGGECVGGENSQEVQAGPSSGQERGPTVVIVPCSSLQDSGPAQDAAPILDAAPPVQDGGGGQGGGGQGVGSGPG